jgi:hypothetical protein
LRGQRRNGKKLNSVARAWWADVPEDAGGSGSSVFVLTSGRHDDEVMRPTSHEEATKRERETGGGGTSDALAQAFLDAQ